VDGTIVGIAAPGVSGGTIAEAAILLLEGVGGGAGALDVAVAVGTVKVEGSIVPRFVGALKNGAWSTYDGSAFKAFRFRVLKADCNL